MYFIGAHDVCAKRSAPILVLMLDIFNTFNYTNDLSCRLNAFKLRSTKPAAAFGADNVYHKKYLCDRVYPGGGA